MEILLNKMSKEKYIPRLKEKYDAEIMGHFEAYNKMRIPKIIKISLNMGLGDAKENKNSLKQAVDELSNIAGQKAVITRSKKAISNFKLREGDPVGVKVTLRGNNMYEFLDRLISISTPRIRDFRGFSSKGFDNFGNYNFGITEQIAFPEIDYDKVNTIRGMNLTIVTTAESKEESHSLLKFFGFPINDIKQKNIEKSSEEAPAEAAEETPVEEAPAEAAEETPIEENLQEGEHTEEIPVKEEQSSEEESDKEKK
tara:strand:- start:65 stop:829 length:765 start_codon:yes stop_codon:yes gene_type:complete